jgi:hypothetical protein
MLSAKSVEHFALSGDKSRYGLLWCSTARVLTEGLSHDLTQNANHGGLCYNRNTTKYK